MENLDKGYIKLYRSIRDNWVWEEKPFSRGQAWIDIILSVNHKNTKIMFDGNSILVKRGSFITSISKLADRWGWSRKKVTCFLNGLRDDSMLDFKCTTKGTCISLRNYALYQEKGNSKRNSGSTSEEHQRNIGSTQTMNDIRMIKNEKEYKGPSDGSASADSDDDEGWMDPLETQELYERMKRNEEHV